MTEENCDKKISIQTCAELIILSSSVKANIENLADLKTAILGNGKAGIKADISRIDSTVQRLDGNMKTILASQVLAAEERTERKVTERLEIERQRSFKVIALSVFEKMISPVVVGYVLYIILK